MRTRAAIGLVAVFAACGGDDGGTPPDDEYIDVACWNLRMLSDPALAPRIAEIIQSLNLDLVTVEEVEPGGAFIEIINNLPGWDGSLLNGAGSATGGIGVMFRTAAVDITDSGIAVDESATSPRSTPRFRLVAPPLRSEAEVDFDVFAVHLKAGTTPADEQARIDHLGLLEAVVQGSEKALVLGDFNADYDDPRGAEVFATFPSSRYTVMTKTLDDDGGVTFLPAGIMLDHMIATVPLLADRQLEGPFIPDLTSMIPDYETAISDHLPVVVRIGRKLPED